MLADVVVDFFNWLLVIHIDVFIDRWWLWRNAGADVAARAATVAGAAACGDVEFDGHICCFADRMMFIVLVIAVLDMRVIWTNTGASIVFVIDASTRSRSTTVIRWLFCK